MSVDTTMAVLYAQSGMSTNVANAAMVGPQAAVAMSRVLAAEAARQERDQVEKNEKTDNPDIQPDDGKGKGLFRSRWRTRRPQEEPETDVLYSTPFTGNLLNIKV